MMSLYVCLYELLKVIILVAGVVGGGDVVAVFVLLKGLGLQSASLAQGEAQQQKVDGT